MTALSSTSREWVLKAQSPIWTGDADRNGGRTVTTGLLGSLRWWFEVLVRGLGGSACDPAESDGRCPDKNDKHCVVCELLGCTGRARKFRFDVLDEAGKVKRDQIKKDGTFRFRFTPLHPMRDEEWTLLDLTLRLIADYGAIGGKTVYKPTNEPNRQNASHHRDYGLIQIHQPPRVTSKAKDELKSYVDLSRWCRVNHGDFAWASLEHFWCVKGRYLARDGNNQSSFNRLLGRSMKKNRGQQLFQDTPADRWLAGLQQESKKVFSFKEPEEARRTFGFVKPGLLTLDQMRERLNGVWQDLKNEEFLTGPTILDRLLSNTGGRAR